MDSLGSRSLSPHDPLVLDLTGETVHLRVCVCVSVSVCIRMCIILALRTAANKFQLHSHTHTHTHPHTHIYAHTRAHALVIDDSNLCLTFSEKEVESGIGSGGLKTRNMQWILMY